MSSLSPRTFEEAADAAYQKCFLILVERQRKYGSGNIDAFKLHGIVVRLRDKLARLERWYVNPEDFDDETLEDTFIDVANYAVIALMLMAGNWGLKLEKELRDENVDLLRAVEAAHGGGHPM